MKKNKNNERIYFVLLLIGCFFIIFSLLAVLFLYKIAQKEIYPLGFIFVAIVATIIFSYLNKKVRKFLKIKEDH